jgi:hypothetical protein
VTVEYQMECNIVGTVGKMVDNTYARSVRLILPERPEMILTESQFVNPGDPLFLVYLGKLAIMLHSVSACKQIYSLRVFGNGCRSYT